MPDRVVEVFATPAAQEQYAALLAGADVTLVDDRALASLSDAVNPAGVVAVCRHFDEPLAALVEEVALATVGPGRACSRSAPTCATPATPAR